MVKDFALLVMMRPLYPAGPPGSIDPVTDQSPQVNVNNLNSLLQRVAGASIRDIENLISELLRDLLHAEGKRVQREISGYAQLSQAAMKSTRLIVDNVDGGKAQLRGFATADQLMAFISRIQA
jgi:ABC-type transporter Mla subunit MlaD